MATTQHSPPDPLRIDSRNPERRYRCPNGHADWEPRSNHVCCRDCRRSTYPRAIHGHLWDARNQRWIQCHYVTFE